MTPETRDDQMPEALRRLAVLAPDPVRSERARRRCRAILADARRQPRRAAAPRRSAAVVLESGLVSGVSVGYLVALIADLLRVYTRR